MKDEIKILGLGDSVTLTSGFSRVLQNFFKRWKNMGAEIHAWGIGFGGWGYKAHPYVDVFFPAGTGQAHDHWAGQQRLLLFLKQLEIGGYTHVFILQDTFQLVNFDFPQMLRRVCTEKNIRSVYYFPVDAPLDPEWTDILAAVDVPVAFTEYGRVEAKQKMTVRQADIVRYNASAEPDKRIDISMLDYTRDVQVLPHGVDTTIYHPLANRAEIRKKFWSKEFAGPDDFLMVNVNVNQRRKDVGRSLELLKAVRELGVPAKLVMHMSAASDDGLDLELIGRQLGLRLNEDWCHHDHLFVQGQGKFNEAQLVQLYNIADLYLTTTLGEGWGLGITEALACGTPVAVPLHTSCQEIADQVIHFGLLESVVPLPVENSSLFQGFDNSRQRKRVNVSVAAQCIRAYYASGSWRQRPGLNQAVRDWLDWGRVAAAFMKLMTAKASIVNPPSEIPTPKEL